MINFIIDMESEALLTLKKLEDITIPARPIMKRAAESAAEDSRNRYIKAWGRREDRVTGVYSALKKAIFGSRMSGRLTGSTLRAIKPRYDKNIAGVSMDGTWPDVQGNTRHKVAVQKVIDELKAANSFRPAGLHGTGNVKERKQYHGQVSVTWTTMGLNIIWPRSVRGFWGNRSLKAEPYANKQYNKGRWGIEKFLNITRQTFHRTFLDVSKYIQQEYLNKTPEVTLTGGSITDKEADRIAKQMSKESKYTITDKATINRDIQQAKVPEEDIGEGFLIEGEGQGTNITGKEWYDPSVMGKRKKLPLKSQPQLSEMDIITKELRGVMPSSYLNDVLKEVSNMAEEKAMDVLRAYRGVFKK